MGSEPAIYKVTLGGSLSNPSLGLFVVADGIDEALFAANEFIARMPWRDNPPPINAIQLKYVADYVVVHRKYLDRYAARDDA